MTEDIYQNLVRNVDKNAPESIHLCDYPAADEKLIDTELESNMDEVLKIVVMGRAARNAANIKNRQPIGQMYVKAAREVPEFFIEIIEDELNIKAVEFTEDVSEFTSYSFKPQLRTVGPKYGKQLAGIKEYLANVDGNAAMAELKSEGAVKFEVNGVSVSLAEEDLLIEMAKKEGYLSEADNYVTVVLDTNLSEELIREGYLREVISKIQTMRKDADFEVTDRINIYVSGNDKLAEILKAQEEALKSGVLAEAVLYGETTDISKEWNINGEKITIGVSKCKK